MRLFIIAASFWVLVLAKPEMYREKEDFQYSRSSTDEGSKSGYYGAQRGNMGGNFEKAHNMDSLAQHQMSSIVGQVDGELGDGANTRTGSIYTAGNSRGIFGSGNYDLTNLKGRNFAEGASFDNSLLHSSHSQTSGLDYGRLYSANNARYRNSQSQISAHNSGYQTSGLTYGQIEDQRAADQYQDFHNYEHGSQSEKINKYSSHSGSQTRQEYDQNNANIYSANAYDYNTAGRRIYATPVRIYGRPGTRVAIPISAQSYDASQSSLTHDQNTIHSDAELLSTSGQQSNYKPLNNAKHYESSYSYRKEWEKHNTIPVILSSTENPFPKNSELYEDTQSALTADNLYQSETDSANSRLTNTDSSYLNRYSDNIKSSSSSASHSRHQSQQQSFGARDTSNMYTHSQGATAGSFGSHALDATANSNNLVEDIGSKPKSYHHSYSYHKSWERRGDPYVIKPIGGASNQESQRLTASDSKSYLCSFCVEDDQQRVKRSYGTDQYEHSLLVPQSMNGWESDLGQQTQNKWNNLDDLGQQVQNQWGKLEDLGQKTQNQMDNLEDLGQQTQNQWGQLEDLGQQSQNQLGNLEDLGQQTQNQWGQLEDLGQKSQHHLGNLEELGQQTQNQWGQLEDLGQKSQPQLGNLEDLGQQTQNQWGQLEDLGQQSQNQLGNLEDLGQQTQNQWGKLDDLGRQSQNQLGKTEDLGQEAQNQLGKLENLGQQSQNKLDNLEYLEYLGHKTQNPWEKLEDLGQQVHNQWRNSEDLGQQTQNHWHTLEDLGQQTQNQWHDLDELGQSQGGKLSQQTQNQWSKLNNLSQQESKLDTQAQPAFVTDLGQHIPNTANFDQFYHMHHHHMFDKADNFPFQHNCDHYTNSESNSNQNQNVYIPWYLHNNLDTLTNPGRTNEQKTSDSKQQGLWDKISTALKDDESSNFDYHHVYSQQTNKNFEESQLNEDWSFLYPGKPKESTIPTSQTSDNNFKISSTNDYWSSMYNSKLDHPDKPKENLQQNAQNNKNGYADNESHDISKAASDKDKPRNKELPDESSASNDKSTDKPRNKELPDESTASNDKGRGDIGPDDTSLESIGEKSPEELEFLSLTKESNYKNPGKLEQDPLILSVVGIDQTRDNLNNEKYANNSSMILESITTSSKIPKTKNEELEQPVLNIEQQDVRNKFEDQQDNVQHTKYLSGALNKEYEEQQSQNFGQQSTSHQLDTFEQKNLGQDLETFEQQNMGQWQESFENQNMGQHLETFEVQNLGQQLETFDQLNLEQQSKSLDNKNVSPLETFEQQNTRQVESFVPNVEHLDSFSKEYTHHYTDTSEKQNRHYAESEALQVQYPTGEKNPQASKASLDQYVQSISNPYTVEQDNKQSSQGIEQSAPKNLNDIPIPIEPTTEKPGFWGSVWSKTKNAKDKVVSWFRH